MEFCNASDDLELCKVDNLANEEEVTKFITKVLQFANDVLGAHIPEPN